MIALSEELLIGALLYFVPSGAIVGAVKAAGTLTLTGDIAADETVTIGAVTYTFKASVSTTANEVKVGANRSETLDNLIAAINLAAGGGSLYGSATVAHPTVTAAQGAGDTMVVTAKIGGTTANAIATTETFGVAGNVWGAATLAGGVNGETVGISAKPADDADWDDYEFGCINRVKMSPTKKTEERECARASGGYQVKMREWVVRDMMEFQTLEYNEYFHRLSFGIDGPITPGVAQSIYAKTFRDLTGWLRVVAKKEDGSTLCTIESWETLRLGDVPEWKNESGTPTWMTEFIGTGAAELDTVEFA